MFETLQMMGAGFLGALTPMKLLMMAFGVTIGMVIGCLPGLSRRPPSSSWIRRRSSVQSSEGPRVQSSSSRGAW